MAKNELNETERQARAEKARENRRIRKLVAEQQKERRAWLFDNKLSGEKHEQLVSQLQDICDERESRFVELMMDCDADIGEALTNLVEKYGYHHVLAAFESSEVVDRCAGLPDAPVPEILIRDFKRSHGDDLGPIEETESDLVLDL
jgi:hypothetical protein